MDGATSKTAESAVRPDLPDFDVIYDAYFAFVWRTVGHFGVLDANRDDAVQDVFVVVHKKLDRFEGRSSLKTWIFGISHFIAQNYVRRQRRHRIAPSSTEAVSTTTPQDALSDAQAAGFLRSFLSTLDDDKRAVFVSMELEELTAPETAEILGLKLNTVYSRLRLGREAFHKAIANSEFAKP